MRRWEWVHWAPGGEPGRGTLAVYMRSVVWAGKARDTFSLGDFRQSPPSLRFSLPCCWASHNNKDNNSPCLWRSCPLTLPGPGWTWPEALGFLPVWKVQLLMQSLAWGKVCVNELREALKAEWVGAGPDGGRGSVGDSRTVILELPHESTRVWSSGWWGTLGKGVEPTRPSLLNSLLTLRLPARVWKSLPPPSPLSLLMQKLRPGRGHGTNLG